MKIVVVLLFLAVVASLGAGLYFMNKDRGGTSRMATALTFRISLSLGIFGLLMAAQYFGWIQGRL